MTGRYAPDKTAMQEYVSAARDDPSFAAYLETHVFGPRSHEEYVERFVGKSFPRQAGIPFPKGEGRMGQQDPTVTTE
jgi:hypothetical protein